MSKVRLVVVGNGMVGHRFIEELIERADPGRYEITNVPAIIRERDRQRCFAAFLANNRIGFVVFAGIVLDYWLRG